MKKSNQTRKTRVTSQNRVAAGKSRKHNQKREGFSGIKEIFTPRRGKKLKTNRYMLQTSVIVVALFLGLAGYVVRFTLKDSVKVSESSYNKRNSSLSEQTKRGKIISANDKILAFSENNEAGDEIRHYPYENMFAHIIGYTSYGKAGLEAVCNKELLTSHEKLMKQLSNGVASQKNIGDNVITTLDTRLQKAAYEALDDYRGAVVAIEPKTGKVRALVSKPDFDPNKLDDMWNKIPSDSSQSCLLNRATQGLYPPGSTYKILTALEYMEERPTTYKKFSYDCEGETIINSVRISCYENGGKLLIAGNGGSAADSEHIAGELMKRFKTPRPVKKEFADKLIAIDPERGTQLANNLECSLMAIPLVAHEALTTAYINDVDGLGVFAQQLFGFGKEGDVFLGISTSGNSKNVLPATVVARALGIKVIGLTGAKGGELAEVADVAVKAPETETYMVQELHLPIYHCWCLMLEDKFFGCE